MRVGMCVRVEMRVSVGVGMCWRMRCVRQGLRVMVSMSM